MRPTLRKKDLINQNLRNDYNNLEALVKYIAVFRQVSYYMGDVFKVSSDLPLLHQLATDKTLHGDALLALYRNQQNDQTLDTNDLLLALEAETPLEFWKAQANRPDATLQDYYAFFTGPQGDSAYTVWKNEQTPGTPTTVEDYIEALKANVDLTPYVTTEQLNLDLGDYATNDALETGLAGKVLKTDYDADKLAEDAEDARIDGKTDANMTKLSELADTIEAIQELPHLSQTQLDLNEATRQANKLKGETNASDIITERTARQNADSGLSNRITTAQDTANSKTTPTQVDTRADARITRSLQTGNPIAEAIRTGAGGLTTDQVDTRIDLKQVPAIFQSVTDVVPQQHPMTMFNVGPGNSPFMSTPFTFGSDFANVPDGAVVKLGGVFSFGLNPSNGSLPLCSLMITQGTKHIATISNLAAQGGNDIQFLAQRGAGDIKFQPIISSTNELNQTVYPYFNVFNVYFVGAYHDILLEILDAQIALATAETKSLLTSLSGQLPIITQEVQNTNADIEALRQTVNSLVSKIDSPVLDFILAGTVSEAEVGLTTDRTTLGDQWNAEIVDHSTIEPAFSTAPQELREDFADGISSTGNLTALRNEWFDSAITSWQGDAGGSTGSSSAGPGLDSPGPYFHWEASGSARHSATPITIQGGINRSTDVGLWLDHNGARNIEFLYNYVSSSSLPNADAFFVAEQLDKDGLVIATRKYSEWDYNAAYAQGQSIQLIVGGSFISELPGGWRRVGMDLLPECRSIKLYNIPEGTGSGDFVNDLAFYDIRISEAGLDTPSDDASSGASGQEGATGQANGTVQGLLVELETGDLNYDTDTVAKIQDGAVYGVRQVAEIPAGTRTVDTFAGASPGLPFTIALGSNNQHAQATRSFAPSEPIPAGTTVTAHLNIDVNEINEDAFTLGYIWGSGTESTEVFTLGNEFLTVHMDELNGEIRIRTTETGENNLALDGGDLTGYFSFPVATPKVDATTEDVRLVEHRGKTILGFTDSETNPTLVIYYGNGQTFDTGLTNKDFLDHYILTTSNNPGAFRFNVETVEQISVSSLQANYEAGIRYLGLFVDTPHHSQLYGLPGGLTYVKTTGEEANLEEEIAKSDGAIKYEDFEDADKVLCTVTGTDTNIDGFDDTVLTLVCSDDTPATGTATLRGNIRFTTNSTWTGRFKIGYTVGDNSTGEFFGQAIHVSGGGATEQVWIIKDVPWNPPSNSTTYLLIDVLPFDPPVTDVGFSFSGEITTPAPGKVVSPIMNILQKRKIVTLVGPEIKNGLIPNTALDIKKERFKGYGVRLVKPCLSGFNMFFTTGGVVEDTPQSINAAIVGSSITSVAGVGNNSTGITLSGVDSGEVTATCEIQIFILYEPIDIFGDIV